MAPDFDRVYPWLLVLLGVALLLAPTWAPMLHLGDGTARYDAGEVSWTGEHLDVPVGGPPAFDDDLLCIYPSQYCEVAKHVVATDGVESRYGESMVYGGADYYRFALVNGTFYEFTVAERNGTSYVVWEQVTPETALTGAATGYDEAPSFAREAVDSGSATVRGDDVGGPDGADLPSSLLVERDGTVYRVYRTGGSWSESSVREGNWLEGGIQIAGVVLGAALLVRAGRRWALRRVRRNGLR